VKPASRRAYGAAWQLSGETGLAATINPWNLHNRDPVVFFLEKLERNSIQVS
jgi:hypothetical protein